MSTYTSQYSGSEIDSAIQKVMGGGQPLPQKSV